MPSINFLGKTFVQNYHLSVPFCELIPDKGKSLTDKVSLHDNLILHGDNLKALKALLPTYAGKIKCIYIDPPYNTGNEGWAYNDNVNNPRQKEWLGEVVNRDDLTRHDKWLSMMMPRLKLLRELLSDDGAIFISIDDNEQHRLRLVMDEIFGEENFVGYFIWRKKEGGGQTDDYFVTEHEFIAVYRKSDSFVWTDESIPTDQASFNREDEKGKFNLVKLAKWGTGAKKEDRPKMHFPVTAPDGKNVLPIAPDGSDGRWRVGKDRMQVLIKEGLIQFEKKDNKWIPYEKIYFSDGSMKVIKERSIQFDLATTGDGTNELTQIFGTKDIFQNPKPSLLIKTLVNHVTDKDSIILDSFAGSGTTAHAVLDLNKEDGGDRKFILVECEDYADKITAERVRRVIKGVPSAKDEKLKNGLGGVFSYFELGKPIEIKNILKGGNMPSYIEMARYVFYTATGEEFNEKVINEEKNFIGESKNYRVYLFYKSDKAWLKNNPFTLDQAEALERKEGKRNLVFAPNKYLNDDQLAALHIDFAQLPFEIYKLSK